MTGNDVVTLAEAYIGEGVQTDNLHHRLSPALMSMGLAELFAAENAFRGSAGTELLSEPPMINDLAQTISYDWHILRELLPLWLASRYFDLDDDTERSAQMLSRYEARYAATVPCVWDPAEVAY